MSVYNEIITGANLSQFAQDINLQNDAIRSHERGASEPSITPTGLLWHCTNTTILAGLGITNITEAWLVWKGTGWAFVADPQQAAINAGGTIKWGANQPMGGHKFTDMGLGSAGTDSVRLDQVVLRDGSQALTADWSAGGNKITNLGEPTADTDAARRMDVGGTAHFMSGLDQASRIDAGPIAGDAGGIWVSRINQTAFVPEMAIITIRARLNRAKDGMQIDSEVRLSLSIPRNRHIPASSNGGIFYVDGGHVRRNGASVHEHVELEYDQAYAGGTPPSSWDVRTAAFGTGPDNWQLYVKFHTGVTRGVEFWVHSPGQSDYVDLDEAGGGAEGVAQLLVIG